jgi:hypothetical protein
MAEIEVTRSGEGAEELEFRVDVVERGSRTEHRVTVRRYDLDRLSLPGERPEEFLQRCFRFLLEREPKESILSRFDVSDIGVYFPRFEEAIRRSPG